MNARALHLDELPYCPDSCELFERIRALPAAALLDSSYPHCTSGRYDVLVADPRDIELPCLARGASEAACRAWFDEMASVHRELYGSSLSASPDLPFSGGLLGYLGYEAGIGLQKLPPATGAAVPAARLRAYDWCVIQDHLLQRAVLVARPEVAAGRRAELQRMLQRPGPHRQAHFRLRNRFRSNLDADAYRAAFEQIQRYITAGDCYQVNLAQRFSAACEGDPWVAYRHLRAEAAAPFSAFLDLDRGDAFLSLSPERFISLQGHHVETAPIKGTRPRYADPAADSLAARELLVSEKDRAENLMIVDLLRNDLGRSCVPGSIRVDRLFEVQSFPTVHHLVSTISGELASDRGALQLLRDSFPGGSITGAPKRRAMEIIAELEPDPREVYCGSIVYISADGRMDSNIAIRSLLCNDGQMHCWGGGGIVADSRCQAEFQETFDKVGRFLRVLEAL